MHLLFSIIVILHLVHNSCSQFSPETYPDPRIDPFSCKIPTIGPVCDPSGLLTYGEKELLANQIQKLLNYAATVPNTSPSCQLLPGKHLEIIAAVVDKIGALNARSDIERFANNLKIRYQLYQSMNLCDLMVLIVNSHRDRQVFTVAGKDTKLTKDVLKTAFEQNINHFRNNNYAAGLHGMAEYITNSYRDAQLGTPLLSFTSVPTSPTNEMNPIISEAIDNLVTTIPQTVPVFNSRNYQLGSVNQIADGNLNVSIEDESDQLWIDILSQAISRCGNNYDKLGKYAQAFVEETMSISLRLISDQRYLAIEERMQTLESDPESRSLIWDEAKAAFIDQLYYKYLPIIRSKTISRCPIISKDAHTLASLN